MVEIIPLVMAIAVSPFVFPDCRDRRSRRREISVADRKLKSHDFSYGNLRRHALALSAVLAG
jgi:hypothetical protein